jgi:hypothetical protein
MDFNAPDHMNQYFNNCGQSVYLQVVHPGGQSFALDPLMTDRPAGTGLSREDYTRFGWPTLYVCPDGFLPVDGSGNSISKPVTDFKCRKR